MERNSKGQFLPAPVKVGSFVVNNRLGFNPGFTPNRGYKVIKTFRCMNREIVSQTKKGLHLSELHSQWEFVVLDDDGIERRGDLRSMLGNCNTPADKLKPVWEVIKPSKQHSSVSAFNRLHKVKHA